MEKTPKLVNLIEEPANSSKFGLNHDYVEKAYKLYDLDGLNKKMMAPFAKKDKPRVYEEFENINNLAKNNGALDLFADSNADNLMDFNENNGTNFLEVNGNQSSVKNVDDLNNLLLSNSNFEYMKSKSNSGNHFVSNGDFLDEMQKENNSKLSLINSVCFLYF